MAHLIDKDALVAEINRLIAELIEKGKGTMFEKGRISAFEDLKLFLNTLEVKEADLDEEIEKCLKKHNMLAVGKKDFTDIAKLFFELGLSVNNPITASDRGTAEEIIINLKRVEQDYRIDLTKEKEWVRNQVKSRINYETDK